MLCKTQSRRKWLHPHATPRHGLRLTETHLDEWLAGRRRRWRWLTATTGNSCWVQRVSSGSSSPAQCSEVTRYWTKTKPQGSSAGISSPIKERRSGYPLGPRKVIAHPLWARTPGHQPKGKSVPICSGHWLPVCSCLRRYWIELGSTWFQPNRAPLLSPNWASDDSRSTGGSSKTVCVSPNRVYQNDVLYLPCICFFRCK